MKTPTNRTIGVYAGSFDPLTVGHLWMIEQGMRLFDQLVVAIGINPEKQPTFSVAERLDMLKRSTAKLKNVKVDSFDYQFLIHYAQSVGAQFILRGIRGATDYEYERVMRNINGDLNPEITTLFLMPPRDIAEVSSGMVRGLIGPAGWQKIVKQYVPAPVHRQILAKHHGHPPTKKVG